MLSDIITSAAVLLGVFLLAYSAIRHKDLLDVVKEIRDIVTGKIEDAKEKAGELRYAN